MKYWTGLFALALAGSAFACVDGLERAISGPREVLEEFFISNYVFVNKGKTSVSEAEARTTVEKELLRLNDLQSSEYKQCAKKAENEVYYVINFEEEVKAELKFIFVGELPVNKGAGLSKFDERYDCRLVYSLKKPKLFVFYKQKHTRNELLTEYTKPCQEAESLLIKNRDLISASGKTKAPLSEGDPKVSPIIGYKCEYTTYAVGDREDPAAI